MNDELIAKTPIGEIVVGIKSDHDYPGIFVELRGEHLNDRFKEGAVRLAWVEYSSDKQCLQTISFASCAGYTGRRDTCSHTCTVDLPIETKGLKVSHFCLDCRVLLKDHAENGFVLADLYVEDAIDIYPATVRADYTIRDYRITVSEAKVRSEMELIVLGIAEGLTFVD